MNIAFVFGSVVILKRVYQQLVGWEIKWKQVIPREESPSGVIFVLRLPDIIQQQTPIRISATNHVWYVLHQDAVHMNA